MSVRKTLRECYEVREDPPGREWANITLHCWDRQVNVGTAHEGTYYCGEIAIQSSCGIWGGNWTACGSPFKQFLQELDFDYAFGKFMGLALERYDGDGTLAQIKLDVCRQRREGTLSRSEARLAMDAVDLRREQIRSGNRDCGYALMDIAKGMDATHPMHDYFADPAGWPICRTHDPAAKMFWKRLWPLFTEALAAEQAQESVAALAEGDQRPRARG